MSPARFRCANLLTTKLNNHINESFSFITLLKFQSFAGEDAPIAQQAARQSRITKSHSEHKAKSKYVSSICLKIRQL